MNIQAELKTKNVKKNMFFACKSHFLGTFRSLLIGSKLACVPRAARHWWWLQHNMCMMIGFYKDWNQWIMNNRQINSTSPCTVHSKFRLNDGVIFRALIYLYYANVKRLFYL